jgi:Winged helix DNA-binding domain
MRVLSRREVNRATLERQFLLRRVQMPAVEIIEHLVGLQAQTPHTWYVGLWNRLVGFQPEEAATALAERRLVRIALMRSTIHLVSARDAVRLRPLVQPVIERSMNGNFGRHLVGLERAEVVAAGRAILDEQPLTFSRLGRELGRRWPDRDEASLAQAIRAWVPLVQVPPRGVWGRSGLAAHACLETWVGRVPGRAATVEDMVLRYLGAFGPASVRDMQTWSGVTRLGEVADRLRPRLVTFADERGVELFDLPDAPRPDPDTPAPARYLYDFDNLVLSHADRSRVITDGYHALNPDPHGPMPRLVLLDGFTAALWTVDVGRSRATLTVYPFAKLSAKDKSELTAEGDALLAFLAPKAESRDVVFT